MADDVEEKIGSDTAPAFQRNDKDPALVETSTPSEVTGEAQAEVEAEAEAKIVKICKKCMVSQSDGGKYCVSCGSELVPIRAVRETYVGEMVGGKYKIVDRLGAGGMGEVYLGINEPLGQRVAVKFLSKKFTADEGIIMRFLNEARSYCKVNHPNAVTLLEYGQHDDGALYLITEFIEGKSLTETLKEVGPFDLEQVISVAVQVCEVLSAAHSQGVIHRDLKPDNIMLMPTSRGRYAVKVLDFGIAKIVDDDHDHGPMTETGSVFGTPEFMSPEQARGDSADPRSDLYAMGIILFYIATGKLPFKGKNKFVVLNKQLNERPPRPSEVREDIEVPLRLEAVILKCLNKEPEERYQSADDLLEALEEVKSASGSMEAAKSGTARLGPISSEVADTAADTPSQPHQTDAPGIHDSETVAYDLDMPLNTDPERAASVDLGVISDTDGPSGELEEVDLAREWADRGSESYEENRSYKAVAAALAVVLVGGGLFWALGTDSETPKSPEGAEQPAVEAPAAEEPAAPEMDINRVLVTGQVIGSLSAAEDNLRHGDLAAAKRALDTTYMWMDDEQLPEQAAKKRGELAARLEKLERQAKRKADKEAKRKADKEAKEEAVEKLKEAQKPGPKPAEENSSDKKKPLAKEKPAAEETSSEDADGFALPPKRLD